MANKLQELLDAGLRAPAASPARAPKRIRVIKTQLGDSEPTEVPEMPLTYIERMAEQRRQWKEQDRARFYNPDATEDGEKEWQVYAWLPVQRNVFEWQHAGVRRKKPQRRKPMTINRLFAIVRQQFHLAKDTPVILISTGDDLARKRRGELLPPPKHYETTRPVAPPSVALAKRPRAKTTRTRIRKDVSPKLDLDRKEDSAGRVSFTFKTKYVAWGRALSGSSWTYLGPAQAKTKHEARREIEKRFPLYPNVELRDVKTLSYSLRSRLKTASILPGKTTMPLPEVRS